MPAISDPRSFPLTSESADQRSTAWHALVEACQSGSTGQERTVADRALHDAVVAALRDRDVAALKRALDTAPSAACYRQLLRAFDAAWAEPAIDAGTTIVAHGFALPVVLVAAAETAFDHPLVLAQPQVLVDILQKGSALAGNATVALSSRLCGLGSVRLDALDRWLLWRSDGPATLGSRQTEPAPLRVGTSEGAHLRFLVGSALAAPGAKLFDADSVAGWGTPLAKALSADLSAPGLQLLGLPRAPAPPLIAARRGRLAHREVALQLFASNAIRGLRANFGDPSAVVSAHATGTGGELRISLSSPFAERDAEGFRCPLFPFDRIDDVASAIVDLLRACRISDIRLVTGIQSDREPATGAPLFFRADTIAPGESTPFH